MRIIKLKNVLFVVLINLIIALGFYYDNLDSGYSVLASDVHSIIPIAQKFDNPELFKNDLFLNTLDNVKYYTPFFVQPLRFVAKFTHHNYLQALNVSGLITHFLYGILWFLLIFKFTRSFWVSLTISVLIRGLVWLPGYEIWGITDLWSIMPRTIYIALMPIPFLVISYVNKYRLLLSAFFIGLVFNFHPITGLGGIIIYLSLLVVYYYSFREKRKISINIIPVVLLTILAGMLPFVITYFTKTDVVADYDVELYRKAFLQRIPSSFESPLIYLKQWLALKILFFFIPLLIYFIITLNDKNEFKKAKLLLIITFIIILCSSISVYLENVVNSLFNLNLRLAFQFIRLQKLAILPSYFAMAFLLMRVKNKKHFLPTLFIVFVLLLTISKSTKFAGIPLIGDDIFRSILPNSFSIVKNNKENFSAIDEMMEFISKNTNQDDVFFGSPIIRASTKRSVVLDYKGASAIIEGNPKQFIQWYVDTKELESLETEAQRVNFLVSKNVNYILTSKNLNDYASLIHNMKLYKIK